MVIGIFGPLSIVYHVSFINGLLNEISKYIIHRDEAKCKLCGTCVNTCQYGVHVFKTGYKLFTKTKSYKCIGHACEKTNNYCVAKCPNGALELVEKYEDVKNWVKLIIAEREKMTELD